MSAERPRAASLTMSRRSSTSARRTSGSGATGPSRPHGEARTLVDTTGPGGNLAADVEGLTIYHVDHNTGYLIASSQGDDTYAVYTREAGNA